MSHTHALTIYKSNEKQRRSDEK